MIVFPNCKINIGLYVTEKRQDGFHNIESVFYPVQWQDALEVLDYKNPAKEEFQFRTYSQELSIPLQNQLIYKAWRAVSKLRKLPPVDVHFYKNIPMGAGLGGGSSDAAAMIRLLDQKFNLLLNESEMLVIASELGSDCAFFIRNTAQFATGRGEQLEPCSIHLSSHYILLVYPGIHCDTAKAYGAIRPKSGRKNLKEIVENNSPEKWKNLLVNDFEAVIFDQFPQIAEIKKRMYEIGAEYASMSGSGSTVYGLFRHPPEPDVFKGFRVYLQKPEMVFA